MFLKQLWHYNKTVTIIFLLFITSVIFINYKQGAVATPVLQYGMYCSQYHLSDTQNILKLYINNKAVDFTRYSMSQRDQLQVFLEGYLYQNQNNIMVFNSMKHVLDKIAVGQFMKKQYYCNNLTDKEFTQWYIKMAERVTGEKIMDLQAYQQKFLWRNNQLTAVAAPVKISCIAY